MIQDSDSKLAKIKQQIQINDQLLNDKFCLIDDVLYKNSLVFDQIVQRLCLPSYLGREILSKLHQRNHCHLGEAIYKVSLIQTFLHRNVKNG